MALLGMGESKWRMIRRVLKKKRFQFADCRNMARQDQIHFDWLVAHGLFRPLRDGWYEVTDAGREAADLGFYESGPAVSQSDRVELTPIARATPAGRSRTRSPGRP